MLRIAKSIGGKIKTLFYGDYEMFGVNGTIFLFFVSLSFFVRPFLKKYLTMY